MCGVVVRDGRGPFLQVAVLWLSVYMHFMARIWETIVACDVNAHV
jgi:hypothetical protein